MGDTLPEVAVTGLPPVDLYNGTSADITPWAETVQIDIFENAKAASGETLRTVNLSYDEYARMRQDNPHLGFPELEKPANPNSGATQGKGAAAPAAVSLTPNVLQARVYSMSMAPPPRHQPEGFKENAQHVGGMAVGAAQAVGSGALAAASYASDSLWQLGDLVTGGYFHDTELMQGVWQRQGARGEAVIGAVSSPVETTKDVVEDIQIRKQQAEALRAAGDFYEAGKVAGTILADVSPVGGAVGVVKKLPDGTPPNRTTPHGSNGVVITRGLGPLPGEAPRGLPRKTMKKNGWPDLPERETPNFSSVSPEILPEGTKIYRVISPDSNPAGSYWAYELPTSKAAWRSDYAVLESWNSNGLYVEHTVGPGGLKAWVGKTAGQNLEMGGMHYPGGATQIWISPNSVTPSIPMRTGW